MEFEDGDIVYCKPGHVEGKEGDNSFGGSGYWPGRVFTVKSAHVNVAWPKGGKNGYVVDHPNSTPLPEGFAKERIEHGVYLYAIELYEGQDLSFYKALKEIKKEIYGG